MLFDRPSCPRLPGTATYCASRSAATLVPVRSRTLASRASHHVPAEADAPNFAYDHLSGTVAAADRATASYERRSRCRRGHIRKPQRKCVPLSSTLHRSLMADTLFHKVWNAHRVRTLPSGQTQLFIGLHLIHEVTSPQAFDMIRQHGWKVAFPERTVATIDHIVPTSSQKRPFLDVMAEEMTVALERNCKEFGIKLYLPDAMEQGIVHVIGPQLGLTQPGMTIACGDSHTSAHGAFGAIAMGIGTSQVRDVLASQCLAVEPLKVRRIDVNGKLPSGVYAKDVILTIIRRLGVQ